MSLWWKSLILVILCVVKENVLTHSGYPLVPRKRLRFLVEHVPILHWFLGLGIDSLKSYLLLALVYGDS